MNLALKEKDEGTERGTNFQIKKTCKKLSNQTTNIITLSQSHKSSYQFTSHAQHHQKSQQHSIQTITYIKIDPSTTIQVRSILEKYKSSEPTQNPGSRKPNPQTQIKTIKSNLNKHFQSRICTHKGQRLHLFFSSFRSISLV